MSYRTPPESRQAVLDALTAQIAVLDASGRIVEVNESWRRFARENAADPGLEQGVGFSYLDACHLNGDDDPEGYGEKTQAGILAVLAGKQSEFSLEYPCHAPDQPRWFMVTVTSLGNGCDGAVVAHMDISPRVLAEQESRRRREEMARAARLNSVTVLAGSLVHELAQPLAAASLYSDSLATLARQQPLDSSRMLAAVDDLRTQVARAEAIVDGLRRFMRRGELRTEPCPIDKPVRDALELVMPLARRKSTRLEITLPPMPIRVLVNPLQIEQVMVNLLCNAIEAIDRVESTVRIVQVLVESDPREARITVSDTGPGLSPVWADRIFDVFETENETGMGMGLAISRTIVEAHGGRLWAEVGAVGAVLHFTLPLHAVEDPG